MYGKDGSVHGTINGNGGYRYARRHLDDGVEGIYAIEYGPFYGNPDYRQCGIGSNDAGQGGSHTGSGNNHFNAALAGILGKFLHCFRCAVSRESVQSIDDLNADDTVDGILIQLPLPKHIDSDKVIARIRQEKDVDGFHPLNVAALWQKQPCVLPCTPKGIMKLLKDSGVELAGRKAVVIGRSTIVGLPVAKLLLDENATVTITHSRTKNLADVTREAEILVVAIGRPKFVTADMVGDGAVVIDVGVNRDPETGKLCGDVDFEACEPKASLITKVPGGVGPMTIACLIENTIEAFLKKVAK